MRSKVETGAGAPSLATAIGVQIATLFAYSLALLSARYDNAGLISRLMGAWLALIDAPVRWLTGFALVGEADGGLALMHRHLLIACIIGSAALLVWARPHWTAWAAVLVNGWRNGQHANESVRKSSLIAQRVLAMGAAAAALLLLFPSGGIGGSRYLVVAPLASGAVSFCLVYAIVLGEVMHRASRSQHRGIGL